MKNVVLGDILTSAPGQDLAALAPAPALLPGETADAEMQFFSKNAIE